MRNKETTMMVSIYGKRRKHTTIHVLFLSCLALHESPHDGRPNEPETCSMATPRKCMIPTLKNIANISWVLLACMYSVTKCSILTAIDLMGGSTKVHLNQNPA